MEDERVAINNNNNIGLFPNPTDTDATIGKIVCVKAVMDVSSVRNVTSSAVMIIINSGETKEKPDNCSPIKSESPVDVNPLACANPTPNSRIIPQGILLNAL